MDKGIYSFSKIKINKNLLDEVWSFDPMSLDSLDNITISKYAIALSQYLIYYKYEVNKTRAELSKKKRLFENSLSLSLDDADIKKYKTKKAASDYLVNTNTELYKLDDEINNLQNELVILDGIDKSISEYIATFKRELTRREQEIFAIRSERK
jgi:hypothetical protein